MKLLVIIAIIASLVNGMNTANMNTAVPIFGDLATGTSKPVGVQLFQWPFKDIAKECVDFLGPNGFGFVQTSPAQGHVKRSFDAYESQAPWYLMYQPIGYSLGNRLGSEQDFIDMVNTCRNASVDVIVDVVLNHNSYTQEQDSQGNYSPSQDPWSSLAFKESFPDPGYNASHFNDAACNRNIMFSPNMKNEELWNCRLGRLADLKTSDSYVRSSITSFLNRLLSIGVVGFRVDAAICVPPSDWQVIYGGLQRTWHGTRPFITQELFVPVQGGGYGDYLGLGRAINFQYGNSIGRAFRNLYGQTTDSLPSIIANLPLQDSQSTVLVENHDKERDAEGEANFALSRQNFGWYYKQASAFLLLYPFGIPIIHSGYSITYNGGTDDTRESPLSAPYNSSTGAILPLPPIKNNICTSGWTCQHRYSDIFPLVRVRNYIASTQEKPQIISLGPGSNQVYWTVVGQLFVLLNSAQGSQSFPDASFSVSTGLPPGTYCNMVYGYMQGNTCVLWPGVVLRNNEKVMYVVDDGGKTVAAVRNNDKSRVLVLYTAEDGYMSPGPEPTKTTTPSPTPTPILLEQFTVSQSSLSILATVLNIAYAKTVQAIYCDTLTCTNVIPCSYVGKFTPDGRFERWKCMQSEFPHGLNSFYLQYAVSGQVYTDKGPAGQGYNVSIAAPRLMKREVVQVDQGIVGVNVVGINTKPGQVVGVVVSGAIQQTIPLTSNCTGTAGCTWTGSFTVPLLVQVNVRVVVVGGVQCGGGVGVTVLPQTQIFVNQGPANDNVYHGVRYINLDSVSCPT